MAATDVEMQKLLPTRLDSQRSGVEAVVLDAGSMPVLAPDRKGFDVTIANSRRPNLSDAPGSVIPRFDPTTYTDFDVCYVFTPEPKKPEKMMSREEIESELMKICRARDARLDPATYGHMSSLHPIYKLQGQSPKEMTRRQFQALLMNCFYAVLEHIGACYVIEEGHEKKRLVFVRARLVEDASKMLADYFHYSLQTDRNVTNYEEFRADPDYNPPYLEYQRAIEECPEHLKATKATGRIWNRYDRLGRSIEDPMVSPLNPEVSIFRDIDRIRLLRSGVYEFLNMEYLVDQKWCLSYYPLKQETKELALQKGWASFSHLLTLGQPLNDIRSYFGEEIALYFAWLGFYTQSLILPSVVGTIMTVLVLIFDANFNYEGRWLNHLRCAYCLFLGSWCSWFYERWIRREKVLALKWGVDRMENSFSVSEESPYFKEEGYIVDPVQPDRYMKYYSPTKRRLREALTTTFVVVMTGIVVIAVNDDLSDGLATFMGYPEAKSVGEALLYESGSDNLISAGVFLAGFTSILVKVFDWLFSHVIANSLTKFENHQYVSAYENSLNFKMFYFKVADYFAMLIYLAFFKEYFSPCEDTADGRCLPALRRQLLALVIVELTGNIMELLKPFAKYMFKTFTSKAEQDMPRYQKEYFMQAYTKRKGLMSDYLDQMIQFGFMSFFSLVCPYLPILAFLINIVEIRTDAYKLCHTIQRPFPKRGDDIGVWDDIQGAITFMGMICNVALCAFVTVGYYHGLSFRLFWFLVLMLFAVILKETIKYKFPPHSSEYHIVHDRHGVVIYNAFWGDKDIEKLARTMGRTSRFV